MFALARRLHGGSDATVRKRPASAIESHAQLPSEVKVWTGRIGAAFVASATHTSIYVSCWSVHAFGSCRASTRSTIHTRRIDMAGGCVFGSVDGSRDSAQLAGGSTTRHRRWDVWMFTDTHCGCWGVRMFACTCYGRWRCERWGAWRFESDVAASAVLKT